MHPKQTKKCKQSVSMSECFVVLVEQYLHGLSTVPLRLPHAIHLRVRTCDYTRALWFLATFFNLHNLDSDNVINMYTVLSTRTHSI